MIKDHFGSGPVGGYGFTYIHHTIGGQDGEHPWSGAAM
jgi:hypothetical protein